LLVSKMWSREGGKPFSLKSTPSLICNNLTTDGEKLAYASLSDAFIVDPNGSPGITKLPSRENQKCPIFQVKWITIESQQFLVTTSTKGLQIWNADGSKSIFDFQLDSQIEVTPDRQHFLQGVACLPARPSICVGSSSGSIFVFDFHMKSFQYSQSLKFHTQAINSLTVNKVLEAFAACDDQGTISVWNAQSLSKKCAFEGTGHPSTSLLITGDILMSSYTTGHIRLFSLSTETLCAEIAAHSRCINAMALHPTKPMFASVSEDTYINVWSVPDFDSKDAKVELVYSNSIADHLLTGVVFLSSENIVAASYDAETLTHFKYEPN